MLTIHDDTAHRQDASVAGACDFVSKERMATDLMPTLWSRELGKEALLSREQEAELARRLRTGDAEARRRFIDANLKLVVNIAKRCRSTGVPLEDLIQEGNIGLVRAVDKFDPGRGFRLPAWRPCGGRRSDGSRRGPRFPRGRGAPRQRARCCAAAPA